MVLEGEFPPDIRVENEIKALNKAGIKVVLACFTKKETQTEDAKEELLQIKRKKINPFLLYFKTNNITFPFYTKWWSKFLNEMLKHDNFDFIHAHDLPMFRVLDRTGLTKQYQVIADLHEDYPVAIQNYEWATKFPNRYLVRPKSWFKIEKKILKNAAKIVVLSENFKINLLRKYTYLREEQIVVFPNVPDLEYYRNQNTKEVRIDKRDNIPLLTYFGRIATRRGIITTVKALKILIKSGIQLKLLLIGPIEKRNNALINDYLNDIEVKDYIQHINWIDIGELRSYMKVTDISISPIVKNEQHEAGVANKVFQYMMFGKPIIVSNCRPQAKVIQEEKCGLVFESENPGDLAEKIKTLMNNPGLTREMGENGQKAIFNKYNTDIMGENLRNIYKEKGVG